MLYWLSALRVIERRYSAVCTKVWEMHFVSSQTTTTEKKTTKMNMFEAFGRIADANAHLFVCFQIFWCVFLLWYLHNFSNHRNQIQYAWYGKLIKWNFAQTNYFGQLFASFFRLTVSAFSLYYIFIFSHVYRFVCFAFHLNLWASHTHKTDAR